MQLLHFRARVSACQKTPRRKFRKQQQKMSAQRHPTPMYCGWTGTALGTQSIRKSGSCDFFFSFVYDLRYYYSSWPYRQKWAATFVVSSFTFITPVSSAMIAPAATQVAEQLGITSNVLVAMTISIFILGYGEYFLPVYYAPPPHPRFSFTFSWIALGPLVCSSHSSLVPSNINTLASVFSPPFWNIWPFACSPTSESFLPRYFFPVLFLPYICSTIKPLAWNIGCGFAQNANQLIAFRFLSGIGGSAPLAVRNLPVFWINRSGYLIRFLF